MKLFTKQRHYHLLFWFAGLFSFIWLILRSGLNPKRIHYPCQQVAFPIATQWAALFIFPFIGFFKTRKIKILLSLSVLAFFILASGYYIWRKRSKIVKIPAIEVWESTNPVSTIYAIDSISKYPSKDTGLFDDAAMNKLLELMEEHGDSFYLTASTKGMIGTHDIVVIKANFQWEYRLGTNLDRIKGLVWKIINHPDGFEGEIIIADNTQNEGLGIGKHSNNALDTSLCIFDYVKMFQDKNLPVSLMKWTELNNTVDEYSEGNMKDGYVFEDRVSYPKFTTPEGNLVSLKHGMWDDAKQKYISNVKLINFPVLKSHGMAGATVCIKNYLGVVSLIDKETLFGDYESLHTNYIFGEYALPARGMELVKPVLNIVDATWTARLNNWQNVNFNHVPTDMLFASTDPVALSWYTAKYVLTPVAYTPLETDPDNPEGNYGKILPRWSKYLTEVAGYNYTKEKDEISVFSL